MLYAYCDCSMRNDRVTIAAIVVTKLTFIDYELRVLDDIKYSAQGELRAIMLAMELVNRNFDTPQRILLQSDCKSIVDQYAWSLKHNYVYRSRQYYGDWMVLMEQSKGHEILAKHIHGHEIERSYNVICDYGARAML